MKATYTFKCIHTHTNTSKNINTQINIFISRKQIQSKVHSTKTTYKDSNAYIHIQTLQKTLFNQKYIRPKQHTKIQMHTHSLQTLQKT